MLPEMTNFLSGRKPITCINMHDTRIVHLPASRPNLYIRSRSVVIFTRPEICCHRQLLPNKEP